MSWREGQLLACLEKISTRAGILPLGRWWRGASLFFAIGLLLLAGQRPAAAEPALRIVDADFTTALELSRDGAALMVATFRLVTLYGMADGAPEVPIVPGGAGIVDAALSPDGRQVYVAGTDAAVSVHSRADGGTAARLDLGRGIERILGALPDGSGVAVVVRDTHERIVIWRPHDNTAQEIDTGLYFGADVAAAPDGRLYVTTGDGIAVYAPGAAEPERLLAGGETGGPLAVSDDGAVLFVADMHEARSGVHQVWQTLNTRTGEVLAQAPIEDERNWYPGNAAFAGEEVRMARVFRDGEAGGVIVEHLPHGSPRPLDVAGERLAGPPALSHDGRFLALQRQDLSVEVHDLDPAAGSPTPLALQAFSPSLVPSLGHFAAITAIAVAPDGLTAATADRDGAIWLWDVATQRAIRHIDNGQGVLALAFVKRGSLLAAFSDSGALRFWKPASGSLEKSDSSRGHALAAAFVGEDRLVGCTQRQCTVGPLSQQASEAAMTIDLALPSGAAPQIAADAQRNVTVLSLGKDGVILLRLDSGEIVGPVAPGDADIASVAVLSDGTVAAGTRDGVLLLLDASNLAVRARIRLGERAVTGLVRLAGGRLAATVNGQGRVGVPDLPAQIVVIDPASEAIAARMDWSARTGGSSAYVDRLVADASGATLFAATQAGLDRRPAIQVWRMDPLEPAGTMTGAVDAALSLSFAEETNTLIVDGIRASAVWNLGSGGVERHVERGFGSRLVPVGEATFHYDPVGTELVRHSAREGERRYPVPQAAGALETFRGAPRSGGGRLVLELLEQLVVYAVGDTPEGEEPAEPIILDTGSLRSGPNVAISPDGTLVAVATLYEGLHAYRADNGERQWAVPAITAPEEFAFSGDGGHILMLSDFGRRLTVLSAADGETVVERESRAFSDPRFLLAKHWDGSAVLVLVTAQGSALFADPLTLQPVAELRLGDLMPSDAVFDASGRQVLLPDTLSGRAMLWDMDSGRRSMLATTSSGPDGIAFSPDGALLAIAARDGAVGIWRTADGGPVARLVSLATGGWAAIGADGRYDAADPGDVAGLSWVLPDTPFEPLPVEIFYREYFEPGLLMRRIMREDFPPISAPEQRNRVQPRAAIVSVTPDGGAQGTVSVLVRVASVERDGVSSGLGDVKLFRNGQLVGVAAGPLPGEDAGGGTRLVRFDGLQLPRIGRDADGIVFSAYAFNADGIKSETATFTHAAPPPDGGRKRRAYVVAIGVNGYDNPAWDLRYAAADAEAAADLLAEGLRASGEFDTVAAVRLISESAPGGGPPQGEKDIVRHAARADIEAVLARLAGADTDARRLARIPGAGDLARATPDDVVYISFSGHGLAGENGRFHIFTQDIGSPEQGRAVNADVLARTLDSDRLGELIGAIDAGELVFVIDACNAAASVEGQDFKPGPMGSRGLGQLAYDKAMRVLAASQAEAVALESPLLRHGMLTYAMLREGLQDGAADLLPQDGRISLAELLKYGTARVPALYTDIRRGSFVAEGRGAVALFKPAVDATREAELANVQRPTLFDFRRGAAREDIFVIR